jgi:hypothetical protein
MSAMGTKSREVIWSGPIMGAEISAKSARGAATKAAREADRAEARMVAPDGRLWRSRTALPDHRPMPQRWPGLANRCKTRASLPLDAIRRPRDTPLWKLEASLKCRSCRKGRYAPPVHMIKLTEARQITPYKWVHPDDER